jgi:hypothetical protein
VFFDFDVKRLEKALSVESENLYVLVLQGQGIAAEMLIRGRCKNIGTLSIDEVFSVLAVQPPEDKSVIPFLTADGKGINVPENLNKL